jgi:folate-binding protein YgfZ
VEKFIVADDVQVVDVAGLYGLLSVQGPTAGQAIERLAWFQEVPPRAGQFVKYVDAALGEIYLANQPRVGSTGYDLFVPADSLGTVAERLRPVVEAGGGRSCGWQALEVARIEAGIPRFGADMDEKTLPQECGIESRAVSYSKGCYIGQEVLNRIHTQGHVNRQLRLLRLPEGMAPLPVKGDKLFHEGKEVGHVTSVAAAPSGRKTALGYVRREAIEAKAELVLQTAAGQWPAVVCRI